MAQLRYVDAEVICFRCRAPAGPRCRCKPRPESPRRFLMSAAVLGLCLGSAAALGTLVGAAIALVH